MNDTDPSVEYTMEEGDYEEYEAESEEEYEEEEEVEEEVTDEEEQWSNESINNDDEEQTRMVSSSSSGHAYLERVETKKGTVILHPMQIDFPAGCVTAILGPSGGGKTTLLNVITDNIPSNMIATGEVVLPGQQTFVPQDDRLHGFFTCKGYLMHYARLSGLPTDETTEANIEELLIDLGLQEQSNVIVGDLFLKGLSGGQKRRLSVALEALTNPKNFFLDEPTSGLDAESALQVMQFLKKYVRAAPGRRVIVTIHQPSSFIWQLIDHTVLLSKGKLMYQGPRSSMETFFQFAGHGTPEAYNPADHYVTAVNSDFQNHAMEVEEWAEHFEAFQQSNQAELLKSHRTTSMVSASKTSDVETSRASIFRATMELTRRYFKNLWFNPGILGTRIAMYIMLALMVGALFWDLGNRNDYSSIQSRNAVLFYCVAFFVFMSVAVLPFTVMERAIVDKEVRNSYYHPAAYQFAQGICTIPGVALLAFLTTLIIVSLTKLREPLWYFLNMFLALFCAESLAQLVSHVVPHFVIGMALLAGLYGFFMLFMGFMIIPSDFPGWLRWTYNVGFHTYSWRTFMYTEYCCEDQIYNSAEFQNGLEVLESFEIENVNRGNDMVVLACYGLIVHLLSFVVLHLRYYSFRGSIVPAKKDQ